MALYERFVDGEKVARAFTVDGSDEDTQLAELAQAGTDGWERADEDKPKKRPARAEKE